MAAKEINIEQLRTALAIQCTWPEIEALLGVSRRTIERKHAQVIEHARGTGKMSLRRKQWETAMAGSVPMLIWLGKVYLLQKDTTRLELTDEIVDTYLSRKNTADSDPKSLPGEKKE